MIAADHLRPRWAYLRHQPAIPLAPPATVRRVFSPAKRIDEVASFIIELHVQLDLIEARIEPAKCQVVMVSHLTQLALAVGQLLPSSPIEVVVTVP